MMGMRRMLASVAFVAAMLAAPVAGAQAAVAPTDVAATWVPASGNVPGYVSVTFTADPLQTYTALMCQSDAACTPAPVATDTATSPLRVEIAPNGEFGCRIQVTATDAIDTTPPAPGAPVVVPQCDQVAPALTPSVTGGNGCVPFVVSGTAVDQGAPVPVFIDGALAPVTVVSAAPFAVASVNVTATDAVQNGVSKIVTGQVEDSTGPGPVTLEITTDPPRQQATLTWDPVPNDAVVPNS
jgi:hypothetical protein